MKRRNFLIGTFGFGGIGKTSLGTSTVRAGHEDHGSVTFEHQSTNGRSIVLAKVSTDIDATIAVRNQDADERHYRSTIQMGEYTDYEIELDKILSESAEMSVDLFDQDGHGFAHDTALVEVDKSEQFAGFSPTLFESNSKAGFNYPYFLYAPTGLKSNRDRPILVEPNNTGSTTDDFEKHKAAAKATIEGGYSRRTADKLQAPFLVPVFPRPRSEPVDWTHYVHQLDDDTMEIEEGPLKRVDLQLLNMIDHAQDYLREQGYSFDDSGVMLNGYSASGNFVDRFAVLHPNEVISVTAGGLNGMALLPLEVVDGRRLPYHVGIANIKELTGKAPDLSALSETNQFLHMGAEDTNDTIPYDDAWTNDELRQLALDVYGDDMTGERFPKCQELYREAGVEAQFRIYPDAGHTPRPAEDDIIEFHERSIADEDVSHLGQNIVPQVRFNRSPSEPTSDHHVEFNASGTDPAHKDILLFVWDFDDEETETGKTVTHSFSVAGTYEVELTVVFDDGSQRSTSKVVKVTNSQNGIPEIDFTITPTEPNSDDIVEFDASKTDAAHKEILLFTWDFDDDETETGKKVTHSFSSAGTYEIELVVTFSDGAQKSTIHELTVTEAPVTQTTVTDTRINEGTRIENAGTSEPADTDSTESSPEPSQPGFGIGSALAGIVGGSYVLKKWFVEKDEV